MATPSEIDRQVKFEREAIRLGVEKLHKNVKDLEKKDYASASIYGCTSINMLLPLLIKRIDSTKDRIHRGTNGVMFREIKEYLDPLKTSEVSAIALKITFDKVFGQTDDSNLLVKVSESIGLAIEQEAQMQYYEREYPGLLNTIKKNYWHNTTGTQQKFVIVRTMLNRSDSVVPWIPWGAPVRVKLGGWLLDAIYESSGWFQSHVAREGRKTVSYVIPTPEFAAVKDDIIGKAELFSPISYPMLIEPNDWTNERAGGYLLNEVRRGNDMVRRGAGPIQGEKPIEFLNKIQKVGLKLNPFIVGVADHLLEKGIQVGKFVPVVEIPIPPKPADIADNKESRKDYRRRAAEVMNQNAASFKRSCRTRMTMQAVDLFRNEKVFYLPWSFDYRGRAYAIPAFLTPQDTDFGKSLLRFADESFMTPEAEEWLAFQVATTYGLDKSPIQARLEWSLHHHDLISRIATDPIGCLSEWEAADEPWQFLAACEEYYHCVIQCDRQFTGLMTATDATCSGLQILAGLAKDKSTASLVNVTPSDRPQDAYKVIAEVAKPNVPESIRPHMDRKVTKRTVMTIPYNAKPFSNRSYIREALKEKGVEISKEDLTETVKAVRDAMDQVVPGPMAVMAWIESEVSKAIRRGEKEITWVTPSGFVVTQRLMKKVTERVYLHLMGRVEVQVATKDGDKVDLVHHKNATAPNLIHSLDSSLLHLATLRFDAPIALIHDSVLCRATDMTSLSAIVRETYMHLFAEHDFLVDFARQIGAETEPPIIGDLRPENVLASTYFFC
jgi:DNA-directed RNA polymerase